MKIGNFDTDDFHPVKALTSTVGDAQQWMSDRADDAREWVSTTYDDMTAEAASKLLDVTPEPLKEGVGAITAGSAAIGKHVVEFLDPVGYGLEVGADVLGTTVHAPQEAWESMKMMAHGDVAGGLTKWGKNYADTLLTEGEVLLTVLPTGHVAGKIAKQPVKTARKSLKQAYKATPKHTMERKAIKQDLRQNSRKKHVAKSVASNSSQLADKLAQEEIAQQKLRLGPKREFKAPQRDWSKLGLEEPTSYYKLPKRR